MLSFRVLSPKQVFYSTQSLQNMLSKLLQAQLRSVAGRLNVYLIEGASAVHVLRGA